MKILLFCTVFVANAAFSQKNGLPLPLQPKLEKGLVRFNGHSMPGFSMVPANWPARQMGIFCRYEWKLESSLKLPIRFRVGSMNYCDWLEQKPLAGRAFPHP